jgi:hypothetical protein
MRLRYLGSLYIGPDTKLLAVAVGPLGLVAAADAFGIEG